jgi:hypothetical protein
MVMECVATITVPQLSRTLRKKVPAGDESRKNSDNNVSRKDDIACRQSAATQGLRDVTARVITGTI